MKKKIYCEYCGKPLSENCGCRTELEKKVSSLEQQVLDMKLKISEYEYEDLSKKLIKYETDRKISEMMENARKSLQNLSPERMKSFSNFDNETSKEAIGQTYRLTCV